MENQEDIKNQEDIDEAANNVAKYIKIHDKPPPNNTDYKFLYTLTVADDNLSWISNSTFDNFITVDDLEEYAPNEKIIDIHFLNCIDESLEDILRPPIIKRRKITLETPFKTECQMPGNAGYAKLEEYRKLIEKKYYKECYIYFHRIKEEENFIEYNVFLHAEILPPLIPIKKRHKKNLQYLIDREQNKKNLDN